MPTLDLFEWQGQAEDGESEAAADERPQEQACEEEEGQGQVHAEQEREHVFRVSEINRTVKDALERGWGDIWVQGELGDVTRAASGHVYFTLADEEAPAQLRGVMFRGDARRAKTPLERGARVRMRGRLSLYEARGSFQLIARVALPAGDGDLAARFEEIRRKLESEGLLDAARKRKLPQFPRVVGVVTSTSGAAMHDIVRVARGRCPVRLVVADCRVQGDEAPATIVRAIDAIQRLPGLEVVVVSRGGGSAEELWAFNDERVARAIGACRVPTVSGVGHEVDITISDLIADIRASTPSNAAELVVPDREALSKELEGLRHRVERARDARLHRDKLALHRLGQRLADPRHALGGVHRELDVLTKRLSRAMQQRLAGDSKGLRDLSTRVSRQDPRAKLSRDHKRLSEAQQSLEAALRRRLQAERRALRQVDGAVRAHGRPVVERRRAKLGELGARLDAMSPLKVLQRGYAIALHERTGRALMRADDAEAGDRLRLRLAEGELPARVETSDGSEDGSPR